MRKRYFCPGTKPCVIEVDGVRLGITICEDIWHDGPVEESAAVGANLVVNLNASPFHMDKASERESQVCRPAGAAEYFTDCLCQFDWGAG